ncbi:DegQ family serine endoprotease [Denitromonas iodatirespirans]|uniref:Probable periplasmic serine endoprotease DegP-like n=1 Tax=Denitromonas iodatirespirans TaxID=2795389 RepID=A0A944HA38_DENI1|nr:DegQ family serine endoprotease [Denitromonas iodatirespirans]MBT0964133.1 DegQ family serine endoprotease [Denitromonas iodatirespirans]
MQAKTFKRSAAALAVSLAVAAGAGYLSARHGIADVHAESVPAVSAPASPAAAMAMPDFETIVARSGPAVVNISVEGLVKTRGIASPFGQLDPNDPFSEFFRRFGPGLQMPGGEQVVRGQGSGFIVSPDGVILTNAHVVAEADTVTVKLTDKREFTAKVLGIDKATDLAVLKIDADKLPTLPLAAPDSTRVGQWVVAIGSPFGFENSVTAGIVSAKSRSLPDEGYVPFLQTDVAINPGNSGGPLLNLKGEVVGINSQIYSRSGGYQGVSFAIPIEVANNVKDQLLAHGKVTRGRIGVGIQEMNQALSESFGLKSANGALISQVQPGSPAEKAGLQPGDVILKLNGERITNSNELPPKVAAMAPGSKITLQVWRKGETRDISVTLGAQAAEEVASADTPAADHGRLGVAVRPLNADEAAQLKAKGGVVVLQVAGAAKRAGIQPGDVVLAVNGQPVADVAALQRMISGADKHVALLIQRQDARLFVPVELG